jgi:formylglycine-generating enzyme required for sulfatase activity
MVRIPTSNGSFCIDTTEVTRAQYLAFMNAGTPPAPSAFCAWNVNFTPTAHAWPPGAGEENLPIGVNWCDAETFCKWSGKRLCGRIGGGALTLAQAQTLDAEWVFTCTGAGTRSYPYGNVYDKNKCNGGETDPFVGIESVMVRPECVVSGVYDLAGNNHEWIDSCVVGADPATDSCVIQSSCYDGHPAADMICTKMGATPRNHESAAVGFRCCAD